MCRERSQTEVSIVPRLSYGRLKFRNVTLTYTIADCNPRAAGDIVGRLTPPGTN